MAWQNLGTTTRPIAMGARGMVASAHPLATLAGVRTLQAGGNAVDAAVAVAAALNVCEPFMSGVGGDGYMLIHTASDGKLRALDYVGRSPYASKPDPFVNEEGRPDPEALGLGPKASLVPGAIGGWLTAHAEFGRLSRETVFAPAIEYAEGGFPLTVRGAVFIQSGVDRLNDEARAVFAPDGVVPPPGTIIRQPNLARTYRTLADGGADEFYRGSIAKEIARFSQENGGIITEQDLATYEPEWQEPISINYRGYDIYCPPLPCSGMQYLITLKLVEGFDMAGMGQNSAAYIHHLAEAMKLAVADRTTYAPDPSSPIQGLLSEKYAAERRKLIDPRKPGYSGGERYTAHKLPQEIMPGSIESLKHESTTHFVTVDDQGNAVACTQTLGGGFGSAVVHGSTGLALNNFFHWFDDEPTSPNVIAPNKKVEMCLAPSQIWRDGKLFGMVGTPGSFGIMQTTPQMIMNLLDHQYSIQAAIEAPRFRTGTGYELPMEGRIPADVQAQLAAMGHQVQAMDNWTMFVGGGQGLMIDPESGAYMAGADPRRDGYALAY